MFTVDAQLPQARGQDLAAVKVTGKKPRPDRQDYREVNQTGASEQIAGGVSAAVPPSLAGDLSAIGATIPGIASTPGGLSVGGLPYILEQTLPSWLANFVLVVVEISIFSAVLAISASATRVVFSMARDGRLPFAGTMAWRGAPPSGAPGGNSAFRLASVWDRFSADGLTLPQGAPALLVDDLVDSRWTITVAGGELLRAGASAVLPFAAALRS